LNDRRLFTWRGNLIAVVASIVLGLAAIEGLSRFLDRAPAAVEALSLRPRPYMMFVGPTMRDPVWRNAETGGDVPSRMVFNNLGFTNESDFSFPPDDAFTAKFRRKPDEKLVLITGGSAVYGVGATANERTIAAELEAVLNHRQSVHRYRVLNLGMGGWIAYQQFVGLTIFGLPLDPNWIVVMDGHNDATVTCAHGSGAGNPLEWPKQLYLLGGGRGLAGASPVMQWLLRHSAAARVLTGQHPEQQSSESDRLYFDPQEGDRRFDIKLRGVTFSELDRQVAFYRQAESGVKDLFSRANILFATQPLLYRNPVSPWYRRAFRLSAAAQDGADDRRRLSADLDAYMAEVATSACGSAGDIHPLGYFMPRSALALERKVAEWSAASAERRMLYANVEMLFPDSYANPLPFFVDNVHLNDRGQRRTAEYFAGYILRADLGIDFDPASLAATVAAEADDTRRRQPPSKPPPKPSHASDRPQAQSRPVVAKYVAEGVTVTPMEPGLLRLDEQPGSGHHRLLWSDVPARAGKANTLSIDVWFDTTIDMVRLDMRDASGASGRADFDLAARRVTAAVGTAGAYLLDLGKGWRRLILTVPLANDSASFDIVLMSPDGEAATTYPGENRSLVIGQPVLASGDS
jgi:hypothetical protein